MTHATIARPALRAVAAAMLTLGLGACSMSMPEWMDFTLDTQSAGVDRGYESRNPIEVRNAPKILEIPVADLERPGARQAVRNFAYAYASAGKGPLQVAFPLSGGQQAANAADRVAVDLITAGVPRMSVVQGAYDPAEAGRTGVVLSFDAPTAFSSGCPRDWGDPTRDFGNQTPDTFGCTHQNNLAAMIERPEDLLGPRPVTPALGDRRTTVLGAYAEGEPTATREAEPQTETTK